MYTSLILWLLVFLALYTLYTKEAYKPKDPWKKGTNRSLQARRGGGSIFLKNDIKRGVSGIPFFGDAGWAHPANPPPPHSVSFYEGVDFEGSRADYGVGEWRKISKGFLWGILKHNDVYSSLKVPPGMKVTAYADADFKGKGMIFFTGDHRNLAHHGMHDNISSLKVERV